MALRKVWIHLRRAGLQDPTREGPPILAVFSAPETRHASLGNWFLVILSWNSFPSSKCQSHQLLHLPLKDWSANLGCPLSQLWFLLQIPARLVLDYPRCQSKRRSLATSQQPRLAWLARQSGCFPPSAVASIPFLTKNALQGRSSQLMVTLVNHPHEKVLEPFHLLTRVTSFFSSLFGRRGAGATHQFIWGNW